MRLTIRLVALLSLSLVPACAPGSFGSGFPDTLGGFFETGLLQTNGTPTPFDVLDGPFQEEPFPGAHVGLPGHV